jgi:cyanophycin synthetase
MDDFGQLVMSIVNEALKRGIPVIPLLDGSVIQLGYGANQKRIHKSFTNNTSYLGVKLSSNKEKTKNLLRSSGISVPYGKLIYSLSDLSIAIDTIGYPIVIKPLNGNNGRSVWVNIRNYDDAIIAFNSARQISVSKGIIVERFISGSDYRLLVINNKFIAAAKRTPANITGNGIATIKELIDFVNSDPKRGDGHSKPLSKIKIDQATRHILSEKNLTLHSILPANEILFLKSIANLSAGGTSTDVTDLVHPDNIITAERISRIIGLDICGMDIITPDISVPLDQNNGAVIEVNSSPGFRLHIEPAEGKSRNVAGSVIDMLFPVADSYLISIMVISGLNDPVGIGKLIPDLMIAAGFKVGYATDKNIYIQNVMLRLNELKISECINIILKDPTIDLAIFQSSETGNFATNELIQNYRTKVVIEFGDYSPVLIDDKKSSNSETLFYGISEGEVNSRFLILNADSNRFYQTDKEYNIAYFSLSADNPLILSNLKKGAYVSYIEGGAFIVYNGFEKIKIMEVDRIPYELITKEPDVKRMVLSIILIGIVYKLKVELIRTVLTNSIGLLKPK